MRFCDQCGAPITDETDRFCKKCGAGVVPVQQPEPRYDESEEYGYNDYEPVEEVQKNRSKVIFLIIGALIAVVIIFLALIIGTYSSANKSIRNRDYSKAITQLERFPFFSSKLEDVRIMQAEELLKDDKYFEAAQVLVECNTSKADSVLARCTESFYNSKPSADEAFDYLSQFSSYIDKDMKTALQEYAKGASGGNENKEEQTTQPATQAPPEMTTEPPIVDLPVIPKTYDHTAADQNPYAIYSIRTNLGGEAYLAGWTKDEIQYEINYMLATHGYIFKSEKWSSYFSQFDWYTPVTSDMGAVVNTFNSVEYDNYDFMAKYRDAHFK